MLFTELESEVRGLERYEKFRLLHILVSELEKEEASEILKNGAEYPIISNKLFTLPRPSLHHCVTLSGLGGEIVFHYQFGRNGGPGGWRILDEPEIRLGDHTLVPDIAGWKKERLPKPPKENWISVPPDWICEILSPGTERIDRKKKMPIYAEFGIPHLWLINPAEKTFESYRLESGKWLLLAVYCDDDKVRAEPFDAIEIDLSNLWWE